jgi:transcriptional regulator with XRE-family HTH domain
MEIGEQIRVLREARNLSQADLAELIGCSQMAISNWEQGRRRFEFRMAERFADALDVPPGIFHDKKLWGRIDAARAQVEAAVAEVQSILMEASERRRTEEEKINDQDGRDKSHFASLGLPPTRILVTANGRAAQGTLPLSAAVS